MPIKMGDKTYNDFDEASKAVQQSKGLSKDKADAYVATIDRKQNKGEETGLQTPASDKNEYTKSLQSPEGDEGLGEDEVPPKNFDITDTENLSVSGAPDSMPANMGKLEQVESIIIKKNGKYIPVPVFSATEHDYPDEPCGLCGTAYKDHEGKDHEFVEPKEGRKNFSSGKDVVDDKVEKKWQKGYENNGNCDLCDGTGKVTVEHLGIKECPKCDGSGDLAGEEQMGMMDQQQMPQEKPEIKPRPKPYEKKPLAPSLADRKKDMDKKKEEGGESLKCPNMKAYERWVDRHIHDLRKNFAVENETVGLMFSLPEKELIGENKKKIKGVLAYAGASLNDRIYMPEELAKGHEKTLPLLINHSSIAGAENELHRLSQEVVGALENHEDYQVGEVKLQWHPDKLTLTYEGYIDDPFFAKEVDDMDMAVSLGIFYNSDSPKYCSAESYGRCYTMIEGAEFREVSLVYHPGFPIATIEAIEAQIKKEAVEAQKKEKKKATEALSKQTKDDDGMLLFEGYLYEKKPEEEIEFEGETYQLIGKESDLEKFTGLKPKMSVPKETEKELPKEKETKVTRSEDTKIQDLERK